MSSTTIPDPSGAMPAQAPLRIRKLTIQDMRECLAAGYDDLKHCRTDALLMAAIYPIAGVLLAGVFVVQGLLPFIFPLLAGFALLGPLTTLWFAALSRQREQGYDNPAIVFRQPRLKAIQRLALMAVFIFLTWNVSAAIIYFLTLGSSNQDAQAGFFTRVFTTPAGWELIVVGCAVGAAFAVLTLAISCISFPLVIDRPVSATRAVIVSIQAMARNPLFVLTWGAVVVAGFLFGALPMLLGLVVVLPVLGHGTWHVYRRMTR